MTPFAEYILQLLVVGAFGALVAAPFLQLAVRWVCRLRLSYGHAFRIAFVMVLALGVFEQLAQLYLRAAGIHDTIGLRIAIHAAESALHVFIAAVMVRDANAELIGLRRAFFVCLVFLPMAAAAFLALGALAWYLGARPETMAT